MNLLEWLGESYNPGPVGQVEVGGRGRGGRPRSGVLVCFGVAALLLGFWIYLVLGFWEIRSAAGLGWIALATGVYLLAGYTVHPTPDYSNVGWLGGLFDHPFRYSDDINRFLIFLTVLLWPGRFVSESLVDMVGLVAHAAQSAAKDVDVGTPELDAEPGAAPDR